jgi:hypothetical protein
MSRSNRKTLYNYIVNSLGLSRQMVLEYIDRRLEDQLYKALSFKLHSGNSEKLILDAVTKIVNEGVPTGSDMWWQKKNFDEYVKKVIRQVIQERLRNDYTAELKLTHKDSSIVRKA